MKRLVVLILVYIIGGISGVIFRSVTTGAEDRTHDVYQEYVDSKGCRWRISEKRSGHAPRCAKKRHVELTELILS